MRSVALLLLLGCTKVLAHCEAGVSCKWGSFNGKWTVTDSTWTPDEGKVTNSCVSICLDDDKTVVYFPEDTYPRDRIQTTSTGTNDITFSFDESEEGGTTSNTETWTYDINAASWSGSTDWTWTKPGENHAGTNSFVSTRVATCMNVNDITGSYNGEWITDSNSKTAAGFAIKVSGEDKDCGAGVGEEPCIGFYVLFDEDQADRDEIRTEWNECLRKLTFQFSENEDGGTTINEETWTYKGPGKWEGSTSWTWSNDQGETSSGTSTFKTVTASAPTPTPVPQDECSTAACSPGVCCKYCTPISEEGCRTNGCSFGTNEFGMDSCVPLDDDDSQKKGDDGSDSGAGAIIAVVIVLIVGVTAFLVFMHFRRRRREQFARHAGDNPLVMATEMQPKIPQASAQPVYAASVPVPRGAVTTQPPVAQAHAVLSQPVVAQAQVMGMHQPWNPNQGNIPVAVAVQPHSGMVMPNQAPNRL